MSNSDEMKPGVTLLEMIVVFVIIATMLGMLLPAVQFARESSRRMQCQSNLHQLDIALGNYLDARGRAPDPAVTGAMGGWAIAILPFLEDSALGQALEGNPPLTSAAALALAATRPAIMSCPSAYQGASNIGAIPASHYTAQIYRSSKRGQSNWFLGELPTDSRIAWVTSPELRPGPYSSPGVMPHNGGYNQVEGSGRWANAVVFIDGPN